MRSVGGVRKSIHQRWLAKGLGLGLLYRDSVGRGQHSLIGSVAFPPGQCNSPQFHLVTDYLTKMGIKTVRHPPYSPDLAHGDFCLFPKLKVCCYETIEEMKEAITKVMDMLTQEDIHRAFQKLLQWYKKCIAAEGDYFEGD